MDLKFTEYTVESLFELFKQAYYSAFNEPLTIGSDEFSVASVFAYCLSVLCNSMNTANGQRFIDTATGVFLDAIAETAGLSRPGPSKASALFYLEKPDAGYVTGIPVGGVSVSDDTGHTFTNIEEIPYPPDGNSVSALLYCTETGSKYNNIPESSITNIADQTYVAMAYNTTATSGGDDGCPYTEAGDQAFRDYIKLNRSGYIVGGSAVAYRAKAMDTDNRICDAYVLKDGDAGFVQGKVQIKLAFSWGFDISLRDPICEKVLAACSASDFRPIGDLVEVSEAGSESYIPGALVRYPLKFQNSAVAHYKAVMSQYRKELTEKFDMAYNESELARRFIEPDENGVYALCFEDTTLSAGYQQPTPGNTIRIYPYMGDDLNEYISRGIFQFVDTGE